MEKIALRSVNFFPVKINATIHSSLELKLQSKYFNCNKTAYIVFYKDKLHYAMKCSYIVILWCTLCIFYQLTDKTCHCFLYNLARISFVIHGVQKGIEFIEMQTPKFHAV